MGFLDNVKGALKDALSTQASKNQSAAKKGATSADESATPAPKTDPVGTGSAEARPAKFETYTVKSGDSLAEIGARFDVTSQEIATLNNIENPDLIFPGQVFRIPKG